LDYVDRKIIEALRKDARTPFTKIGKKLGISDATIHYRVKKMLRSGIIRNYTVIVNRETLGREVAGYVLISVKQGKIEEVSKMLMSMEAVIMVQEVHGTKDILVKIGTGNLENLRDVVKEIQENPHVVASECLMVFKTWKE
jgi:Lrp/AsnC family transcriptional regulator for asnA, asnC and gidA